MENLYKPERLDFIIRKLVEGDSFGESCTTEIEWHMACECLTRKGYSIVNYRVSPGHSRHSEYYARKEPKNIDGYHRRIIK